MTPQSQKGERIFLDLSALHELDIPSDQKEQLKAQLIAQHNAEVNMFTKEFARYKQDCRKKAFDWALEKDYSAGYDYMIKKAEQYYNWLISIPEK